ncbi:unnamed protein product [Echinostoma caproni]|uniref:40S ribosomal protein S30 n=1 Tax=Echinostoma caproni TaxID=27848 RepID=A0A183AA22_9TREM|nr:unnamed protein product [Echinostoma caproni]
MSTTSGNEPIDNCSPMDNSHLAKKISANYHNVGAVDQRILHYDRVKPVGTACGRKGNVRAKRGPKPTGIDQQDEA